MGRRQGLLEQHLATPQSPAHLPLPPWFRLCDTMIDRHKSREEGAHSQHPPARKKLSRVVSASLLFDATFTKLHV
eukprot:m.421293 g.421293  ORF g.421293 m.421293 type:complete len:75 (+) comp20196_c2_seq8:461-685(+)